MPAIAARTCDDHIAVVNYFGRPDPDCAGMSCRELYALTVMYYNDEMPWDFHDSAFTVSPRTLPPLTGAEDTPVPEQRLMQNYPNPFNPVTTITFSVAEEGRAHLAVYDVAGKLVRTPVDENKPAGVLHEVTWDGLDDHGQSVATGVYFCRLTANGRSITKKMVLLK
jgi:hypothetical protein